VQEVWVVGLAGGEPRRLGAGHAPAVSPKGDRVAMTNRKGHTPIDESNEQLYLFFEHELNPARPTAPGGHP
jgi:hypothetical protein